MKVAKLGIKRDPALLYSVYGGTVWATPLMTTTKAKKPAPIKVATIDSELDPGFVYFLDRDGDVARGPGMGTKAESAKPARASKASRARTTKASKPRATKPSKASKASTRRSKDDPSLPTALNAELAALRDEKQSNPESYFFGSPTYGEVTLTSKPRGVKAYVSSENGRVWKRLFANIVWLAEEADGGLVGYWKTARAIVYLDNEGSLRLTGTTLMDHFAYISDGDVADVVAFCKRAKLPLPKGKRDRAKSLESLPDPAKEVAAA